MPAVRRTSLNLDFELVQRARKELGTRGTTETVTRALEEVVRRAALESLAKWHPFEGRPPEGYDEWNDWVEEEGWGP